MRCVHKSMEHNGLQTESAAPEYAFEPSPLVQHSAHEFESEPEAESLVEIEASRAAIFERSRTRRRISTRTTGLLTAFTIIFTAGVQWLIRTQGENADFWKYQFPLLTIANLLLLLAMSAVFVWQSVREGRRIRRHAKVLLVDASGGSVGALTEVLVSEDFDAQREAKEALTQQLPNLLPSNARSLTARHRAILNKVLALPPEELGHKDVRELFRDTSKREVDFRIAILRAYQQIGDSAAIPVVEALAVGKARTNAQARIKGEAIECLPFLRISAERHSAQSSLLRGSSAVSAGPDTLLRPAGALGELASAELLRPNDAPAAG